MRYLIVLKCGEKFNVDCNVDLLSYVEASRAGGWFRIDHEEGHPILLVRADDVTAVMPLDPKRTAKAVSEQQP